MASQVMDIQGLSRYLKLAPVTLYKMVKEGKVPCKRIGNSLRFPKEMIDRWLCEADRVEPKTPPKIAKVIAEFSSRIKRSLKGRIKDVRLYGSFARREARIDSDIDIAVIVDRKDLALSRIVSQIASDLSLEADKLLSIVVIEEGLHKKGIQEGYPFHLKIEQEGISI